MNRGLVARGSVRRAAVTVCTVGEGHHRPAVLSVRGTPPGSTVAKRFGRSGPMRSRGVRSARVGSRGVRSGRVGADRGRSNKGEVSTVSTRHKLAVVFALIMLLSAVSVY